VLDTVLDLPVDMPSFPTDDAFMDQFERCTSLNDLYPKMRDRSLKGLNLSAQPKTKNLPLLVQGDGVASVPFSSRNDENALEESAQLRLSLEREPHTIKRDGGNDKHKSQFRQSTVISRDIERSFTIKSEIPTRMGVEEFVIAMHSYEARSKKEISISKVRVFGSSIG
jgi:hypothetical protein